MAAFDRRRDDRSRRVLSLPDREEISRGIAVGISWRSIAAQLHRAPSTISRELRRHGGHGRYRTAANLAWLVHERGIEAHIPVFEKSRTDGISRLTTDRSK